MGKINGNRVFLGGLVAGLIIIAGEIVFHWLILGSNWWFFRAISQPLQQASAIVGYVGPLLLNGIAATWLYAAVRPRFGPGPKTAVLAGFAYWVIGEALPSLGYAPLLATHPWLQPFRVRAWVNASFVELAVIVLATIVGASAYKE